MTYQGYRSSLRSAKSPLNEAERENLRKRAWHETETFSVPLDDPRLTWPERELIQQFAEKLYGKRRVEK
jgi:hypothetical protein